MFLQNLVATCLLLQLQLHQVPLLQLLVVDSVVIRVWSPKAIGFVLYKQKLYKFFIEGFYAFLSLLI